MARSRQSTDEQRVAFGRALKAAAEAAGVGTSVKLAEYLTDNGHKVSQPTVAGWFRGDEGEPSRPVLLLIEELLDLQPGELSCRLGWVPVGTEIDDLEAAILADPGLSPEDARTVLIVLRSVRKL